MNRCSTFFCHHRLVRFSKAFTLASSKRSTERYLLIKKYLFASGKDAFRVHIYYQSISKTMNVTIPHAFRRFGPLKLVHISGDSI